MTLIEFHYDFKLKIDKVDSLSKKNFQPNEIDWILNEAIQLFMKQRYGLSNVKQTGFEGIQKRIDDLKSLHIKSPTVEQPAVLPVRQLGDYFEFKISDFSYPYYFLTRLSLLGSKNDCTKIMRKVKSIQTDDLNDALENPLYKPNYEWGVALYNFGRTDETLDDESSIYVYTDGTFDIVEIYPEYLKQPNRVWIGTYDSLDGLNTVGDPIIECDLPKHTHSEIVDLAVAECSRIIEHPTFNQLKSQKLITNE